MTDTKQNATSEKANRFNGLSMKIRAIFFILVVCYCFTINKTHAHKTPQLVKNAFAATVYLELRDAQGHPVSYGNGFFVSPTLVVTTFQVVTGASQGTARLVGNPKTYPIEGVILTDEKDNLALLQVKIPNIRPLDLGGVNDTFLHDVDSNNHQVYVVGNYQGTENTFSEGEARGISIGKWISEGDTFERVWERDRFSLTTTISPGCNGGPVLNIRGAVIGVASMVIREGKTYNYAIPMKYIKAFTAVFYNNRGLAKLEIGRKNAADRLARDPDSINIVNEKGIYIFEIGLQAAATDAIADFDTAIRLDPNAAVFYNNRGLAKMELKFYGTPTQRDAAISDFDTAIRLDPDYAQAFLNRGNVKVSSNMISSINDYDVAIRLDPNYVEAYFKRAAAKRKSNFGFDPMPDYNTIIKRDPGNVSVYYFRGTLHADRGQHEAALADLDTFLKNKTDSTEGYYHRGILKMSLGQYRTAIADFTAVIHLDVDKYVDSCYFRGRAKRELGEHAAAVLDYKTFIKRNPTALHFFSEQAYKKGKRGGFDAAVADGDIYIQLKPNEPDGYHYRGQMKMNLKQYEAAISDFDTAIRLQPDGSYFYYHRGQAKVALGKYAAAVLDYDTAIRIKPNTEWFHYDRGKAKLEIDQNESAIADFDKTLALEPFFTAVYYYRGMAKANLGRYTEAIADYDIAIEKNPRYTEAIFGKALVIKQLGQVEEAKKDLETALEWAKQRKNVELQNNIKQELKQFK